MGGKVTVTSEVNKGSIFSMEFKAMCKTESESNHSREQVSQRPAPVF